MNKLKILTTILIVLMLVSTAYAQQCNNIVEHPGSVTTVSDMSALTANTNTATFVTYTDASTESTTLTTSVNSGIVGCNGNTPLTNIGGIFTYNREYIFAGPADAVKTATNVNDNDIVTVYNQPLVSGFAILTNDAITGTNIANVGFTDTTIPGAIVSAKDMKIDGTTGDIYVLFSDKATVTSTFVGKFNENGVGYTNSWNGGIYKTGPASMYPLALSEVNTADNRIYAIAYVGQPATDVVIYSIDTNTGHVTSTIAASIGPLADSVNYGQIIYDATNNKVYATFALNNELYVLATTPDGSGNLNVLNNVYNVKYTVADDCGNWQDAINFALSNDNTLIIGANCLSQSAEQLAVYLALDAADGNKKWYKQSSSSSRVGVLAAEDTIAIGNKKNNRINVYSYTTAGTLLWGGQIELLMTAINGISFVSIPAPTLLNFVAIAGVCQDGACNYWLNLANGQPFVGYSITQDGATVPTVSQTPNGMSIVAIPNTLCCQVTLDGGVSTMTVCDVHQAYPDPAPEFSLTTLLLATLLAGGLVLFVVRRRYK